MGRWSTVSSAVEIQITVNPTLCPFSLSLLFRVCAVQTFTPNFRGLIVNSNSFWTQKDMTWKWCHYLLDSWKHLLKSNIIKNNKTFCYINKNMLYLRRVCACACMLYWSGKILQIYELLRTQQKNWMIKKLTSEREREMYTMCALIHTCLCVYHV